MNIYEFDLLYRRKINKQGVTGSTVYLKTEPVEPGRVRVFTHVSIENRTSGYTLCRLSIYDGSTDHFLDEAKNPAADELLIHKQDIILGERDVLRATLTGTITGDDLEMFVCGWEFFLKR